MSHPVPIRQLQSARTALEVNISALFRNFRFLQKAAEKRPLIAVVKANAYGHGAQLVARALADKFSEARLHGFAVATIDEAVELRESGIERPLYLLSETSRFDESVFQLVLRHNLCPVIGNLHTLKMLQKWCERSRNTISVDIKLNTGMNRLGLDEEDIPAAIHLLRKKNCRIDLHALISHFAAAEKRQPSLKQVRKFEKYVAAFRKYGLHPVCTHMENSEGVRHDRYVEGDMARVGLQLYGAGGTHLEPVGHWRACVLDLHRIKKGEGVGYGPIFRAPKDMRTATLGVGYADGYCRLFSNRSHVLIHGKKCPVIGAVSMDMISVDVSEIPEINLKSTATLLGKNGLIEIRAEDLAALARTIPYEVLTNISARVPRLRK